MSNTQIWKYQLDDVAYQDVEMPRGADILTAQAQHGVPCLWARVDPNEDGRENRMISIYGTGHDAPASQACSEVYISTFQLDGGALAFHVFEEV